MNERFKKNVFNKNYLNNTNSAAAGGGATASNNNSFKKNY